MSRLLELLKADIVAERSMVFAGHNIPGEGLGKMAAIDDVISGPNSRYQGEGWLDARSWYWDSK